ncbi:MAG: HDOD domain-containing protein, partial [Oleiphilaceae bacterium]|nr:HDOD domain-containing protein [Oleiphilaceae bacterium]
MSDTQITRAKMPENAEAWTQLLLSKTLPSPFRLGSLVVNSLNKKQSYHKIADQLSHDPVLSFYIMNEANRGRPKGNPTSKTLDHAISMIGTDELQRLIKGLPYKDPSKTDIQSYYYLRTLSSSLYAAHLGKAISEYKQQGNADDIYWSSMFLGVPLWYLWRIATPEMRLIRYAIRSNFKPAPQAEKEVLQCTVRDICERMAEQMHLPDLSRNCYEADSQLSHRQWGAMARAAQLGAPPKRLDDRDLNMITQKPQFIVMLSNLVAHYSAHDWYSRGCLRTQRILASYLRMPIEKAIAFTHEAAASMSREHPIPGLLLPAAKLFLPPRPRKKVAPKSNTPTKPVAPKRTATPKPEKQKSLKPAPSTQPELEQAQNIFEPNPMFHELCDIFKNRADEFTDLHELMNAAVQGIAYGLDLHRATVGLVNRDNSRIKTYYSVGCRDHRELATFETQVIKNTIFEKLVARPASVW